MKASKLITIATVAASIIGISNAQPASALQFSYTSGIQVQNLSAAQASVIITFYNADGSTTGNGGISDTIVASGSKTFFPFTNTQVQAGFNGSAVVSSDQQVAAVVNVLGSGPANSAASYIGFQQGATSLLIPLLMKGNSGFNTWFKLQNTGSATANATITYSDGTSTNATIAPGAAATFDQSQEAHNASVFAASITSNQPVAATIMQEDPKTLFAYNAFTAGTTNPVLPLVNANNSGYITGIQIQNGGNASTNVTVSYTPSAAGTACTETQTIGAGQSATFALNAFATTVAGEDCANAAFVGSAQVTANSGGQPLVAVVNQLLPNVNGEAYGSFDSSAATATVVMPLIMDRNSGFYTGFNVVNVGGAATTVNCVFTGGTSYTVNANLNPGQGTTALQNNQISDGYVGSGTCTAGAGGKIVAVVNELGPSGGDYLLVYEGITAP
jgi:hypothetical protein